MTAPKSVYCACGASWHGRWVDKAADVIQAHREQRSVYLQDCAPVTHAWYKKRFKCRCDECTQDRRIRRQVARARKPRAGRAGDR